MNPSGKWNAVISTPIGKQNALVDLTVDEEQLKGSVTQGGKVHEIFDARIEGSNLAWTCSVTQPFPLKLKFTVTVNGDRFEGKAKAGMFPANSVSGQRI
jgi:hypothetical protein